MSATTKRGAARTTTRVVWGVPSFWIERLPAYYALEHGLFRRRGIDFEMTYFYGGPELCQAVRQGAIQVGSLGLPPFVQAFTQGLPVRIIGGTVLRQLDHYLVAQPHIRTLADLRGGRIGVLSLGSCDTHFIRRMLGRAGLDPDRDVELRPMGNALAGDLQCFIDGEIQAGFVVEPRIAWGEARGIVRVLARVGDYYPHYQWGVMFAREEFRQRRPDLIEGLLEAYREAARAIVADPEASVDLGSRVFDVPAEVFRRALMRDLGRWHTEAAVDRTGLANALEVQRQMGAIAAAPAVEEILAPTAAG